MSLTEKEWETVEENLDQLSDETLVRFVSRIHQILIKRRITVKIHEDAFE